MNTHLALLALLKLSLAAFAHEHSISEQTIVFQRGEAGYYCIKIPVLISTKAGSLLALGEGRRFSCSDFTWTDLILKRSEDGGKTWGPLETLYSNSSGDTHTVIGNAAPVVLSSGRILVPFCRNNLQVLLTYSDDDGKTWSSPVNLTHVTQPSWKWVGTGPPGSIKLRSGRIIVPSYHSTGTKIDGELTKAHMIISDDLGKSWYIGGVISDNLLQFPNENQAVSLGGDDIFVNARTLISDRIGAYSRDGGKSFEPPFIIKGLSEPLEGCEGSTIRHPSGVLYYSGPSVGHFTPLRYNMSVYTSADNGTSWRSLAVVHPGSAAYSSLALLADGQTLGLLYEWSNKTKLIFDPDYFSFVNITHK